MRKVVEIAILIGVVILVVVSSSGCIKREASTSAELDYSGLVSTLDKAESIDYRELISIMVLVAEDWNKGKGMPTMPVTAEPGTNVTIESTSIRVVGSIEEGFLGFVEERGVEVALIALNEYKKGDSVIIIWDYSSANTDVGELIQTEGFLTKEEIEQVGKGERTFFISDDTIIIAGKNYNLTKRAVVENFFPAVWLRNGDYERAVKANLEVALEIENIDLPLTRDEIEKAVTFRNRAKVLYLEGKPEDALSLYEQSLSIGKDVPALCGKAQVLGSRFEGDLSCYVRQCSMCGSDVVGILSISKKEIVWSRHKPS